MWDSYESLGCWDELLVAGRPRLACDGVVRYLESLGDELAERLVQSGKAVGEKLWRMPLAEAYDKLIDTDAADVKNIGGREAGSVTAAQFLQRFVKDVPWAHLDIAGTTWSKKDSAIVPKGATAFGLRLLDRFIADHYEA